MTGNRRCDGKGYFVKIHDWARGRLPSVWKCQRVPDARGDGKLHLHHGQHPLLRTTEASCVLMGAVTCSGSISCYRVLL